MITSSEKMSQEQEQQGNYSVNGSGTEEFGPSIIYKKPIAAATKAVEEEENHPQRMQAKDSKDALTSIINEFGIYQGVWIVLLALTGINTGWLVFSNKFFTAEVITFCIPR